MTTTASYGLDPRFERELAVMLLSNPRLFGTIGQDIDHTKLTDPQAVLALKVAKLHHRETGRGPSSVPVALQLLAQLEARGSVTREEHESIVELWIEIGTGSMSEADVLARMRPVLQRELEREGILRAMDLHGARKDIGPALAQLQRAAVVATVDRSTGLRLGTEGMAAVRRLRQADRLSLGCAELDYALNGGLPRGKAGCVAGAAKGAKSFNLTNIGAHALAKGLFVAMPTLELSEEDQVVRMTAHLTGELIDAILDGSRDAAVSSALDQLAPVLGIFRTKFFPAKVTAFEDIAAWIKDVEEEEGQKVDVLLLDYIDKCGSRDRTRQREHEVQNDQAEAFRLYCHGRGLWGMTASQLKRREAADRKRRADLDDLADSQGKARVFDLILTQRIENDQVEINVAGSRIGRDKFTVGPLPTDLARGRLIMGSCVPGVL